MLMYIWFEAQMRRSYLNPHGIARNKDVTFAFSPSEMGEARDLRYSFRSTTATYFSNIRRDPCDCGP